MAKTLGKTLHADQADLAGVTVPARAKAVVLCIDEFTLCLACEASMSLGLGFPSEKQA